MENYDNSGPLRRPPRLPELQPPVAIDEADIEPRLMDQARLFSFPIELDLVRNAPAQSLMGLLTVAPSRVERHLPLRSRRWGGSERAPMHTRFSSTSIALDGRHRVRLAERSESAADASSPEETANRRTVRGWPTRPRTRVQL